MPDPDKNIANHSGTAQPPMPLFKNPWKKHSNPPAVLNIGCSKFFNQFMFLQPGSDHRIQCYHNYRNAVGKAGKPYKNAPDHQQRAEIQGMPHKTMQSGCFELWRHRLIQYNINATKIEKVFTDAFPHENKTRRQQGKRQQPNRQGNFEQRRGIYAELKKQQADEGNGSEYGIHGPIIPVPGTQPLLHAHFKSVSCQQAVQGTV